MRSVLQHTVFQQLKLIDIVTVLLMQFLFLICFNVSKFQNIEFTRNSN